MSKRKFYIDPESLEILTGMQEIDGKPYYFDPVSKPVGKMVVGWRRHWKTASIILIKTVSAKKAG